MHVSCWLSCAARNFIVYFELNLPCDNQMMADSTNTSLRVTVQRMWADGALRGLWKGMRLPSTSPPAATPLHVTAERACVGFSDAPCQQLARR